MDAGRIVAVFQRNWRDYVCTIVDRDGAGGGTGVQSDAEEAVLAVPMDGRCVCSC